jgi:hypothetical protein
MYEPSLASSDREVAGRRMGMHSREKGRLCSACALGTGAIPGTVKGGPHG